MMIFMSISNKYWHYSLPPSEKSRTQHVLLKMIVDCNAALDLHQHAGLILLDLSKSLIVSLINCSWVNYIFMDDWCLIFIIQANDLNQGPHGYCDIVVAVMISTSLKCNKWWIIYSFSNKTVWRHDIKWKYIFTLSKDNSAGKKLEKSWYCVELIWSISCSKL